MKRLLPFLTILACGPSVSVTHHGSSNRGSLEGARLIGVGYDGIQLLADATIEPPAGEFFDRELNTKCYFRPVSQTDFRCIPIDAGSTQLFSDEACSVPVYTKRTAPCDGGLAELVTARGELMTGDVVSTWFGYAAPVYLRGAEIERPQTLFAKNYSGCAPASGEALPPQGVVFYSLKPYDSSRLAGAKFEWRSGTSGKLQKASLTLDQGLAMTDYFWLLARDASLQTQCSFESLSKCEPNYLSIKNAYTDNTCSSAQLGAPANDTRGTIGSVDGGITLQRLTYEGTRKAFASDEAQMCVEDGDYDLFSLGELVQAQPGEERLSGTGAVQEVRVHADGLNWLSGHRDTARNAACTFEAFTTDGKGRCITNSAFAVYPQHFMDQACSIPVVTLYEENANAEVTVGREQCGGRDVIRRMGQRLPRGADSYFLDAYGRCTSERGFYIYVLPGEVVEPSLYPEIQ